MKQKGPTKKDQSRSKCKIIFHVQTRYLPQE